MPYTDRPSTTDASLAFSAGRNSRFIPHFLASIAMLIIPPVKTSEPPSETSPIKAQSDKSSVIILFTARMAAIIVKSYSEPHLRTSAGAKLTVSF